MRGRPLPPMMSSSSTSQQTSHHIRSSKIPLAQRRHLDSSSPSSSTLQRGIEGRWLPAKPTISDEEPPYRHGVVVVVATHLHCPAGGRPTRHDTDVEEGSCDDCEGRGDDDEGPLSSKRKILEMSPQRRSICSKFNFLTAFE